jgi:hypothetical protein
MDIRTDWHYAYESSLIIVTDLLRTIIVESQQAPLLGNGSVNAFPRDRRNRSTRNNRGTVGSGVFCCDRAEDIQEARLYKPR